jgi:hypothetical protein
LTIALAVSPTERYKMQETKYKIQVSGYRSIKCMFQHRKRRERGEENGFGGLCVGFVVFFSVVS